MRVIRTFGWWCLLLVLSACEASITIKGTVTVPTDIQHQFSWQKPGRLFFYENLPYNRAELYLLGVLCEPAEKDLVIPIEMKHIGCSASGSVESWVEYVEPDSSPVECGTITPTQTNTIPGTRVAEAQQVVFPENTSCSGGEADIDLQLQSIPQAP